MLTRIFILLAAITLLTSCATPYEKPTGTSTAKLLVHAPQTEMFASVQIVGYDSGRCENPMSLGMIGGIANNASDEKLNIPKPADYRADALVERLIPAGKRYLLSVRGFLPGKTCVITTSFVPAVDGNYAASIVWQYDVCYLDFGQIKVLPGGEVKRVEDPGSKREETCTKGLT
jgi:hypothetical protein